MAPIQRPSQYKQSSRKGKKAWRKNIDLSDIEKSIEQNQDKQVTHGTSDLETLKNDDLFEIDTTGDDILKTKLIKRKQIKKKVKSAEILESIKTNSKVAALAHPKSKQSNDNEHKKKIQGVSKKELNRLMALAGRVQGESKLKNSVAKTGLVKSKAFDLWGSTDPVVTPAGIKLNVESEKEVPHELLKKSSTGWSIAKVAPETIKHAPVKVKEMEKIPHAGKSYNPSVSDWSKLIDKEYKTEKANEERRIQMQQYKDKIIHLMETLDDNEEEEDEDEDDESSSSDNEADSKESDLDEENVEKVSLSINQPVKLRKKTKYQRNKQKRHEDKVKLQQELKNLKEQLRGLEKLEEIEQKVIEEHDTKQKNKDAGKPSKVHKKHKLGTKHSVMDDNLEVKFSDELSDSLRKLRPEGNLLYDNVRKLQSSGKIETRVPVKKGRRYKQKITEKWTYKDLK